MYVEMTPGRGGGSSAKIYKEYFTAKTDIPSSGKIICTDATTGVTFQPTYIEVAGIYNNTSNMTMLYDVDYSTTKIRRYMSSTVTEYTITTSETNASIVSINSDGFTLNTNGRNQYKMQVFAMA